MAEPYKCFTCDKDEAHCICHKYCTLCMGEFDVRLVNDGMYYCRDCREACDFTAQV